MNIDTWAFKIFPKLFWQVMYRLTGRCGSLEEGHAPVIGNRKKWLWIGGKCTICGKKYHLPERNHVSYKNYSEMGRHEDLVNLRELRKNANNDAERRSISKAEYNILHEEPHVRAMREDLIKATRLHEHDKIKKVHEYVGTEKKYRRKVI